MKRKYEVIKVHPTEGGLVVVILVHEVGAGWVMKPCIPWNLLCEDGVWQMLQSAADKTRAYEARQRERLDDSLF